MRGPEDAAGPPPHPTSLRSRSGSRSSSGSSTRNSSYGYHRPGQLPTTAQERQHNLRLRLVPWVCGTIIALLNLGSHIVAAPLVQLIELSVCRHYYAKREYGAVGPGGDVDDPLCKASKIQARVAYLVGLISTFSLVSGAWLLWLVEYQPCFSTPQGAYENEKRQCPFFAVG